MRAPASLEPGTQLIGNAYVGVHRCQLGALTECPNWLAWNLCRHSEADIRFDADGFVTSVRIQRENRDQPPRPRKGKYFLVHGVEIELGKTTFEYVAEHGLGLSPLRPVVDPELGTIEMASGDFFELEFDPIEGQRVVGALVLTR